MSRLAKNPIAILKDVTVSFADGVLTVKGPKGELSRPVRDEIEITIEDNQVVLKKTVDNVFVRSLWGTYASHLTNMMKGVTEGYEKKLEIQGVGYKAALKGSTLDMALGFSHPVIMEAPEGIDVTVEKNIITVSGIDKELVGAFAAEIRSKKKPEPYKGKGIRYVGEQVRRKQGKRAA